MVDKNPIHPGEYVRANVIPHGMTVTNAAKMLGVGRVALSNFLNGKAALSDNMAERLRVTFAADRNKLLDMQLRYDAQSKDQKKTSQKPRPTALNLVTIKASDIEEWADKSIEARQLLAVLLRRLIYTTLDDIEKIDFPGFDNAERPGWDGYVDALKPSAWVPAGPSGWEFGVNADPLDKANKDYKTRSTKTSSDEKKRTTYFQVSPRNWPGKGKWVTARRAEGQWRDVIAYDASDLEQWLEHSPATQIWFGRCLNKPVDARSIFDYWSWWAGATAPPINLKIFESSVEQHAERIRRWIENPPSGRPLVVTAPSKEEASAFIAAAAQLDAGLMRLLYHGAFIESVELMRDLQRVPTSIIPITSTQDVASELITADERKYRHSIVIVEQNSMFQKEPDIRVEPTSFDSFRGALSEMGFDDARSNQLDRQSGRSPTILRRLCAKTPTEGLPAWARNETLRAMLPPYVLIGVWDHSSKADQERIRKLTNSASIGDLEEDVQRILDRDDPPLWAEGNYRGVASKLDCFNVIARQITPSLLENFFDIATVVLTEDDPALDLDKDKRWAAGLYDKTRDHSSALRRSVADSLVMLAVHGDGVLDGLVNYRVSSRIDQFVRDLLGKKTSREWQARRNDLSTLAEAAPDVFLTILDDELRKKEPAFACLFEPSDGGALFGECLRSDMLWALELLAWSPEYLIRVVQILAELCRFELNDNWANKPEGTLNDILLYWLPQTSAILDQRCKAVDSLCANYPEIGWRFCIAQIGEGLSTVSTSHRPNWRGYASDAKVPTREEVYKFLKHCRDKLLGWGQQTKNTLSDLVSCFHNLTDDDRIEVTNLARVWLAKKPHESDIAELREKVRQTTRTYRARVREKKRNQGDLRSGVDGSELYELLKPRDPIFKHKWLFEKDWVEFSGDDLDDDRPSFDERDSRIEAERAKAIKEIFHDKGVDGIIELVTQCGGGFSIGAIFAKYIKDLSALTDLVLRYLSALKVEHDHRVFRVLEGVFRVGVTGDQNTFLDGLIDRLKGEGDIEAQAILLQAADFDRETWDRVDRCGSEVQKRYWSDVIPSWGRFDEDDMNRFIEELMKMDRPRAAFETAHLDFAKIGSDTLIKLVDAIGSSSGKHEDRFQPRNYDISQALQTLSERDDVDRHQLLRLDFMYIEVLTPTTDYKFPTLMGDIAETPDSFVQLLMMAYRRADKVDDWEEWGAKLDATARSSLAHRAYAALHHANKIPGTGRDGNIELAHLRSWIETVRKKAAEHDRLEIADQQIGELLSRCPSDESDGFWPCFPVRMALDLFPEENIRIGVIIGRLNQRGVRSVDPARDRLIAANYNQDAECIGDEYPYTATILRSLAKDFERDAERWERDDRVRQRLRY